MIQRIVERLSAVGAAKEQRCRVSHSHRLFSALLLASTLIGPGVSVAGPDYYSKSSTKSANIQASSPATGGATDKDGGCVLNAAYNNHRGESWLAVDPTNPNHLVGSSKFFFYPLFYLFHLGSYASFYCGNTRCHEVIPGFG